MIDVSAAFGTAELPHIVALSLTVSFSATAVAAVVGLPCGAALAICRFPGRRMVVLLANAFLGLPPVVVGLALYLMLSRSGPLGPAIDLAHNHVARVHDAVHGSISVRPQSSKSPMSRVTTLAPLVRAIAAIIRSAVAAGLPARRRAEKTSA